MKHIFTKLRRKSNGASLIEYGMLVGLISVVSIGSVVATGTEVKEVFTTAETTLSDKMGTEGAEGPGTGSPVVNQDWAVLADYPAAGDCSDVAPDGTYDASASCFNVNTSFEAINDFSPMTAKLTIRASGGGMNADIIAGDGGSTTIVTSDPGTRIWHRPAAGNHYVIFPTRNCSDMTNNTADAMGVLSLDFADGLRVVSEADLAGVYCGGDDVTYTNTDLNPNGYEPQREQSGSEGFF
jgi:pilus assembly protein Flp/PilA